MERTKNILFIVACVAVIVMCSVVTMVVATSPSFREDLAKWIAPEDPVINLPDL